MSYQAQPNPSSAGRPEQAQVLPCFLLLSLPVPLLSFMSVPLPLCLSLPRKLECVALVRPAGFVRF